MTQDRRGSRRRGRDGPGEDRQADARRPASSDGSCSGRRRQLANARVLDQVGVLRRRAACGSTLSAISSVAPAVTLPCRPRRTSSAGCPTPRPRPTGSCATASVNTSPSSAQSMLARVLLRRRSPRTGTAAARRPSARRARRRRRRTTRSWKPPRGWSAVVTSSWPSCPAGRPRRRWSTGGPSTADRRGDVPVPQLREQQCWGSSPPGAVSLTASVVPSPSRSTLATRLRPGHLAESRRRSRRPSPSRLSPARAGRSAFSSARPSRTRRSTRQGEPPPAFASWGWDAVEDSTVPAWRSR